MRNWSVTGGYAFQEAFISSTTSAAVTGTPLAQVPRHSFSVWNKYQLIRNLSAGLGVIYRSDVFASINRIPVPVVLPGCTRADAAIYYSFNEHWRLQGNVENLFNTKYYLNADSNTNISPGSPRAVKMGLTVRY